MKQLQRSKRLLMLALLLGTVALLAGQPTKVDAQDPNNALDAADGSPQDVVYVDANGNVGIGTTNPHVPLDVGGHGTAYQKSWEKIVASDSRQAGISVRNGGKTLYLFNNGTELKLDAYEYGTGDPVPLDIQVSSQGNVGIQTTKPETPLHLNTRAKEQGLKITKDGKNAEIFLHVADGDYGYLDLGGGTRLRGSTKGSQFSGRVEAPQIIVEGTTTTGILKITGGADLAEPFAINDAIVANAGTVVTLDPANPGEMRVSNRAYDSLVAGVISGAGGIQPGLTMQAKESAVVDRKMHPVALTGKVYVKATGPIAIGDLLTTSDIPGHAMAAADRDQAFGATIGKAMSGLDKGTGLVLVLVALQ